MITNCTSGSAFNLWSKLQTLIFLKSCWHSLVASSCQEQLTESLSWHRIKKNVLTVVTQQLKTFTQLGPSDPGALSPDGRTWAEASTGAVWRKREEPGAPREHWSTEEGADANHRHELTSALPADPLGARVLLIYRLWCWHNDRTTEDNTRQVHHFTTQRVGERRHIFYACLHWNIYWEVWPSTERFS